MMLRSSILLCSMPGSEREWCAKGGNLKIMIRVPTSLLEVAYATPEVTMIGAGKFDECPTCLTGIVAM